MLLKYISLKMNFTVYDIYFPKVLRSKFLCSRKMSLLHIFYENKRWDNFKKILDEREGCGNSSGLNKYTRKTS